MKLAFFFLSFWHHPNEKLKLIWRKTKNYFFLLYFTRLFCFVLFFFKSKISFNKLLVIGDQCLIPPPRLLLWSICGLVKKWGYYFQLFLSSILSPQFLSLNYWFVFVVIYVVLTLAFFFLTTLRMCRLIKVSVIIHIHLSFPPPSRFSLYLVLIYYLSGNLIVYFIFKYCKKCE